jgi:DNA-binding HxlR family transcriptional regulator
MRAKSASMLIREFVAGSVRFNDLRRGVPKMSPTPLSQRLKELECADVIKRKLSRAENHLTEAGRDLGAVVDSIGCWGQKWVTSAASLENLDVSLLMWDMRRNLNSTPLPKKRTVIPFLYTDLPASKRNWWIMVEPDDEIDLCWSDPDGWQRDWPDRIHPAPTARPSLGSCVASTETTLTCTTTGQPSSSA